ncbi:hypothetical protein JMJ35_000559 [Cladonia borealis]|uniref:Major facilitator superfamily (MFS) profile domain-containing protein n=1 Tax=Cladonia borealis TaxID=184061 RepID=A0AA39RBC9_9LECA|nr:hypothetical protein JMJ35_000559 [Cladonia borealis]
MFGNSRYFGLRGIKLNIAIGALAGLDFLLFGYDQGVMGGLLDLPSFVKIFPEIDTTAATEAAEGLTPSQQTHRSTIQGIAVAAYNVGCFFGAITTIFIGNPLGRRKTIFLGSSIMIVGAALQASSYSLGQFISARLITGFGNGLNTSTVPTWQSECSRSHRRGQLVMIEGAMITCGVMLSYWLDFGFSFLDPATIAWRFPIAFQMLFALTILLFIFELPESPRWLILKGREDEALSVLSALSDLPSDDPYVYGEFTAIKDTVLEMSKGSFRDLFTMGEDRHLHRTILAYVNQVFQQISGINLITYYAATIYQNQIGLSGLTSRALAAANGTEYFLASWIAVFTIERFGRRTLMIFGSCGMVFSMVILAVMDYLGGKGPGIVGALFLFIFNSFFAVGWLGMTWLYPAEIVPLRIRAPANALSTSANWAFNFMVVMVTPVAFASIHYKTYIVFAVINAFMIPVVYFFYPETAYRSLEEMDSIFRKCNSYLTVVKIARDEPRRYDKHGKPLVNYEETEEHQRRASAWSNPAEKARGTAVENREHADPGHKAENGYGGDIDN